MLRINLLAPLLLLLIFPGNANAQQAELAAKTPTGLVLEIVYYKNARPKYLALSRPGGRPVAAWYGGFGRLQNWQLPEGELPVRAVNIVTRLDGEIASITVSLLRGIKFHDQETMVGTYQLRENESVSVKELNVLESSRF